VVGEMNSTPAISLLLRRRAGSSRTLSSRLVSGSGSGWWWRDKRSAACDKTSRSAFSDEAAGRLIALYLMSFSANQAFAREWRAAISSGEAPSI